MQVKLFTGREGWMTATVDPTGVNLPPEHGPWTFLDFNVATEPDELSALRAQGFYLRRRKETDDP